MLPILDSFRFKNMTIKILIFFNLFILIINECDRDAPIRLANDTCVLKYCTKEEYDLGECTLNNAIIKTQFPNNIIKFGEDTFRYMHFVSFSNGDMIIETSSFPTNNKRIFFGLKKDGRYYFKTKDTKEETPFNYLIADDEKEFKYESGNAIIINNKKEYLVSIGRCESYTELFDFDKGKIISEKTEKLIEHENKNVRPNLINLDKTKNRFIFSCISEVDETISGVIMRFDLDLNSNELEVDDKNEIVIKECQGEISSCLKLKKII